MSEIINGFQVDKFNQYGLPLGKSVSTCPLCSKDRKKKTEKCLMLDWKRGLGTCQHCSEVIQLHTYKRLTEKNYIRPDVVVKPGLSEKALAWFAGRGISQTTLDTMKVSEGLEWMPQEGKKVNTIQFNYFERGELINIKYRDAKKNFKLVKDAEKVFYNLDSIIDSSIAVIVEGELDCLALVESGIDYVVSVPNGATLNRNNLDYLDNCIDYFGNKERIIIAVDNDEAGQALQAEFIRRLGAEVCYTANFGEAKDANEALVKFGSDFVVDAIHTAAPVPLENVVTVNDVNEELEDFVQNGFKPGYQVGLQNFDDIFSTYTGQFITVTGIPSSGKSDFVDQMCVGYNRRYGWKVAYASPENQPVFLHAHKLIRKLWEGMPEREEIGSQKWNIIKDKVNDNFFFIDMERYKLEAVLKKGAELVKRKGIKVLVIDPFNKVTAEGKSSLNVNDYTMEYLAKIDQFCRKYNVLTIIVAHPTKMYKGQDGKVEEPSMYNIKGGGEWYDSSYHGLLVHRDYEQKTVKVKVLKVKFQNLGENGAEAHFTWEPKSGLYKTTKQITVDDMPF